MGVIGQAWRVLSFVWTHPANRRRRVRGVVRAVTYQVRARMGKSTLITVGQRGRMWVHLHYDSASKVLYANPPDWNEMQAWRRILKRGDLFVDVGSNVGSYALWVADSGAEVIAIEPSPSTVEKLRENVRCNDFSITVLQCGLAAEPGKMILTRGEGSTNHILLEPDSDGDEIEVRTLDGILGDRYAAGVKIDVEGAERLVLDGARRALSEGRIGVLQLEWNGTSEKFFGETRAPVAEILRTYGYTFMCPDENGILRVVDESRVRRDDVFAVAPGHQF